MLPEDHILRRIDRFLDMGELRDALMPHCSKRGRPSIAPDPLVRMALIGRLYGITSERRLCEEVRFNLAYRWFCRLPLDAALTRGASKSSISRTFKVPRSTLADTLSRTGWSAPKTGI